MSAVVRLCALAAFFWFVMFSPWTAPRLNFWLVMAAATAVLSAAGLWLQRERLREIYAFRPSHVLIGILSALVLYAVFQAGNAVSTQILQFAKPEIAGIYSTRAQASPLVIGLLLLFWIGPAEEIFWRGFVQERLYGRFGRVGGVSRGLADLCRHPRLRVQLHALHGLPDLRAVLGGPVPQVPVGLAGSDLPCGLGRAYFCGDTGPVSRGI